MTNMDYLCIGHVCQDRVKEGFTLGGSASYCSIAAHLLGQKAAILTSFGDNFQFSSAFQHIFVQNKKAAKSTIFENVYHATHRTQYLFERADTIHSADLPQRFKNIPLVHLAPIADEVDFALIKAFHPDTIIAATPQGWMRQWDEVTRAVSPKIMDWDLLSGIDILILSDEDIAGYEHLLPVIIERTKIVVMTRGEAPATIYFDEQQLDFPAYPTKVIDPTGAGDTFATGFLVKYLATKDLTQAMAYGHVVASFCIEAKGLEGLKNLEKVAERFEAYLEQVVSE